MKYVAFLRAINVGGHVVRMEVLRRLFEGLNLADVETFIASGNVIFSAPRKDPAALERRIEAALEKSLGYAVATFVRSEEELAAIGAFQPFTPDPAPQGGAIYIIFLGQPLDPAARRAVLALSTAADKFAVSGREIYWCRRGKLLESPLTGVSLERMFAGPATTRNRNTIVRLLAKLRK